MCCSQGCALQMFLGVVLVNEGLEMRSCSRECAIERGVGMVSVNERFEEDVLFTGVCLADVSGGGARERGA